MWKWEEEKNPTIIFTMHKLFQYWKAFITYKVLIFDRIIPSTFGPYKKWKVFQKKFFKNFYGKYDR